MMRRIPQWFTPKNQLKFQKMWPWALGGVASVLYFYNPEPFDEMAAVAVTKVRKPLLQGMEWLDVHDVDPEALSLELPPDQLFGPLSFKQQMEFLLASLKADNELADGYIARMCIDNMDLSFDPPASIPYEKDILESGGMELLDFAVEDFTERRTPRKHKFFHPDAFLRLVNWLAIYPKLANHFVNEKDGVNLILTALRHAKEDYSRVLAMRSLALFAFQQSKDGDIERSLLRHGAFKTVVSCYRQSTGDPTDTRFLTLLLSSMIRHFPEATYAEMAKCDAIQVVVNNLNISRYKGVPQHIRLIKDFRNLQKERFYEKELAAAKIVEQDKMKKLSEVRQKIISKEEHQEKLISNNNNNNNSVTTINKKSHSVETESSALSEAQAALTTAHTATKTIDDLLYQSDFIPVALGVIEVFPEYYESVYDLIRLIRDVTKNSATPFVLLEYRALSIFSKLLVKYNSDPEFTLDGTRGVMADIARDVLKDPICNKCFDPSVISTELAAAVKMMEEVIKVEDEDRRLGEGVV